MTDQYRSEKDALYEFEVRNLDQSRASIEAAKRNKKPSIFNKPYVQSFEPGGWDKAFGPKPGGFTDEQLKMAALAYVDHPDFMLNKAPWEAIVSRGTVDELKRMFSYLVDFQISAHGMELKCH